MMIFRRRKPLREDMGEAALEAAFNFLEAWIEERRDVGLLLSLLRESRLLRKIFEDMMPEFMSVPVFFGDLENELSNAKEEVIIYSPFTYSTRVNSFSMVLSKCISRGLCVKIITRPLKDRSVSFKDDHRTNLESLKLLGAEVYLRSNFHAKLVVIDSKISYIGGVNVLSEKQDTVDVMLKLESVAFAKVLLEKVGPPILAEMF